MMSDAEEANALDLADDGMASEKYSSPEISEEVPETTKQVDEI